LRAERFDTGQDVAHTRASRRVDLDRLVFRAVAALWLNALRNNDTSVADLVRRKCYQVYGERRRYRIDVSNETYKIICDLVQDQNESESPVAQRGTEDLGELGSVDALFLRGFADDIE